MGIYHQAQFLISANKLNQLPPDDGFEVAFAGRSNAGKSSAINTLTNQKSLARTSKTPGRTQLINFFSIDGSRHLVDLPGYGYAKVAKSVKDQWLKTLDGYLSTRKSLVGIVLLMDIRHPLKEFDISMLDWCNQSNLPVHILLTKCDKLKKGPAKSSLMNVSRVVDNKDHLVSVQQFSALKKIGLDQLVTVLNGWMGLE